MRGCGQEVMSPNRAHSPSDLPAEGTQVPPQCRAAVLHHPCIFQSPSDSTFTVRTTSRPPDFPPEGLFSLHEAAVTRPPAARS